MTTQLRVAHKKHYTGKPTRFEVVLPPGVDAKSAKWLVVAALITAASSRFGILGVLKYVGYLVLTVSGFTAILTASILL